MLLAFFCRHRPKHGRAGPGQTKTSWEPDSRFTTGIASRPRMRVRAVGWLNDQTPTVPLATTRSPPLGGAKIKTHPGSHHGASILGARSPAKRGGSKMADAAGIEPATARFGVSLAALGHGHLNQECKRLTAVGPAPTPVPFSVALSASERPLLTGSTLPMAGGDAGQRCHR